MKNIDFIKPKLTVEPLDHIIRTERQGCRQTIYTVGRPPWYSVDGELNKPIVIGICGGTASGKTTVARNIIKNLNVPWVSLVCMDSFYKNLTPEQRKICQNGNYNFDAPEAFDIELIINNLIKLKKGKKVEIPIYDFTTHSRVKRTKTIYGANIIIFEGILSFITEELRDLLDVKIFVDTDPDTRLARRILRDVNERGRDLTSILLQYNKFVKCAYDNYIAPCMQYADIIVPRGGENIAAIKVILQYVNKQLLLRGNQLRSQQAIQYKDWDLNKIESLKQLPRTNQVKYLETIIRNRKTPRHQFIFYSQRLMKQLCEFAISFLPYRAVTVETASSRYCDDSADNDTSYSYHGYELAIDSDLCAVSILRAGETMEMAIRDVFNNVRIGKLLIQTNVKTNEPELHYSRLPPNIKNCRVIIMDPTVATGAAAVMAIRVILEHEVPQENIMMMSLLMAEQGVKTISYNYPKVKIIAAAIDKDLSENYYIRPGIGNFGDRYFGTEEEDEEDNDM